MLMFQSRVPAIRCVKTARSTAVRSRISTAKSTRSTIVAMLIQVRMMSRIKKQTNVVCVSVAYSVQQRNRLRMQGAWCAVKRKPYCIEVVLCRIRAQEFSGNVFECWRAKNGIGDCEPFKNAAKRTLADKPNMPYAERSLDRKSTRLNSSHSQI